VIHPPVPPAAWAAEGARAAPALEDVAAALVIGREADATALVAIGLARAQRAGRRAAIGDLAFGAGPLRAVGAPGLVECLRDGLPVSHIARPLGDDDRVFLLPAGERIENAAPLFMSPRWPPLVAGFREVDALLLLVAIAGTPGLDALVAAVDGVVAVDLPVQVTRSWPLLATVDRPEEELPPITPAAGAARVPSARTASRSRRRRTVRRAAIMAGGLALAVGAALGVRALRLARVDARISAPDVTTEASPEAVAPSAAAPSTLVRVDTLTLGDLVNPGDSSIAANFTVELIAANTPSGANSGLAIRGAELPATTVAPVELGADGRPWFRALTGAWRDRSEAEAFLATLRARGLVRGNVGRVLRAPYALLLRADVPTEQVPATLAGWVARGVPAYALLQDDGRARLYVGAFETYDQSALLASSLRDLGVAPRVAFRTGRMF